MTITEALQRSVAAAGWTPTRLAYEAGVTEAAARKWLAGDAKPGGEPMIRLQRSLPGFIGLVSAA